MGRGFAPAGAVLAVSLLLGSAQPAASAPGGADEATIAAERLLGSADENAWARACLPFSRELGAGGIVLGSLTQSVADAGIPAAAMLEALRALETAIDLDRDIRDGDRFYVRWEQSFTVDNHPIGVGRVLWVELKTKAKGTVSIHRFQPKSGAEQFWLANGRAAAGPPLRLPLDKIVISSGYGLRRDPLDQPQTVPPVPAPPPAVAAEPAPTTPTLTEEDRKEIAAAAAGLGGGIPGRTPSDLVGGTAVPSRDPDLDRVMAERRVRAREAERRRIEEQVRAEKAARAAEEARNRPPPPPPPKPVLLFMHDGLDLVANPGTPILAAADGLIVGAKPNGLYGNWIRIDHADRLTTVYAHLSRFAPGIEAGTYVLRGEVIGFVGSTGRSTGAHLHFEVLSGGRSVNPQAHPALKPPELRGAELARFKKDVASDLTRRDREVEVAAMHRDTATAGNGGGAVNR